MKEKLSFYFVTPVQMLLLPATTQCFIKLHYGYQFITNSVTQTNLCIKITTLGIQNIQIIDYSINVLQAEPRSI